MKLNSYSLPETGKLSACHKEFRGFTLVEMLMALLIISIILTASLPVITTRQKAIASNYAANQSFPIGGIIIWHHAQLPDNTWLECNGQTIPAGIEYETARQIFGAKLPDFQGVFLRGYGSQTYFQNNGSIVGYTPTTHSSGELGELQGDAIRKLETGEFGFSTDQWMTVQSQVAYGTKGAAGAIVTRSGGWGWSRVNIDFSRIVPTTTEIRPINIAVKYIAKVRY